MEILDAEGSSEDEPSCFVVRLPTDQYSVGSDQSEQDALDHLLFAEAATLLLHVNTGLPGRAMEVTGPLLISS